MELSQVLHVLGHFLIALISPNDKGSYERYTISEAIAIIQCKGCGEIVLGY